MGEAVVKPAKFSEGRENVEKKKLKDAIADGLVSAGETIKDGLRTAKDWSGEKIQQASEFVDNKVTEGKDYINNVAWQAAAKEIDNRIYESARTLELSMRSVDSYVKEVEYMKASLDKIQSQSGGMHNESIHKLKELITKFDSWKEEVSINKEGMTQVLAIQKENSMMKATEKGKGLRVSKLDRNEERGKQLKLIQNEILKQKDMEKRAIIVAERIVKELETMENSDITNANTTKLANSGRKALGALKDAFVKTSAAEGKMNAIFDKYEASTERIVERAERNAEKYQEKYDKAKDSLKNFHKEDSESVKASAEELDEKRQEYEESLVDGTFGEKAASFAAFKWAQIKNKAKEVTHTGTKTALQSHLSNVSKKHAKASSIQQRGEAVLSEFEK